MMLQNSGLVLEGGGMRGVYTAGVLEYFLEQGLEFPYVIGVSAGACIAASYLSKQNGRNKKVNIGFVRHPEYISWKNFIRKGELFGMDFVFDEIPNKHVPYDYEAFYQSNSEFVIGTTECETGKPLYFSKKDYNENMLTVIRASSSLPLFAPTVEFKGKHLLDGGISDPIPLQKAEQDGFKKNVVVLTRNEGYYKKPARFTYFLKKKYKEYPNLCETMINRHLQYNKQTEMLEEKEKNGEIIIIRPLEPLKVSRVEKDPLKLEDLYLQGYNNAKEKFEQIIESDTKELEKVF